jgi:hypothetical protein
MTMTYQVAVERSGNWWAIDITDGLPDTMLGVSQAKRLTDVPRVTRELLNDLLEADASDAEIHITIHVTDDIAAGLEMFRMSEVIEAAAREAAALGRSRAAVILADSGLTMRESGQILGVSHQRVKQLIDRAPDSEPIDPLKRIAAAVAAADSGKSTVELVAA